MLFRVPPLRARGAKIFETPLTKNDAKAVQSEMAKFIWKQLEVQPKLWQLWKLSVLKEPEHPKDQYDRELKSLFETHLDQHTGAPYIGKVWSSLCFFLTRTLSVAFEMSTPKSPWKRLAELWRKKNL